MKIHWKYRQDVFFESTYLIFFNLVQVYKYKFFRYSKIGFLDHNFNKRRLFFNFYDCTSRKQTNCLNWCILSKPTWHISKIPKNPIISITRYHATLKDLLRQRWRVRIRHFLRIRFQYPGMIWTSLKQHFPSTRSARFQINKSPNLIINNKRKRIFVIVSLND